MKEVFAEYLSQFKKLSAEEINLIVEHSNIKFYRKGSILLKEGVIAQEGYLILKGCVRRYVLVNGEERTTHFFTEKDWVTSIDSFINKTPSDHYLSCLEDCYLVVGNESKESEVYTMIPKLMEISKEVLLHELAQSQGLVNTYITDSPEQRYLKLLKNKPDLLQRVPQYILASYIGVKPESLSRIRKRIVKKG